MGCVTQVSNTIRSNNKNDYTKAYADVIQIQNKIKNNSNFQLKCFLISAKSIPKFLSLFPKSKDDIILIEDLVNYKLEENIEVYDDIYNCHDILVKND